MTSFDPTSRAGGASAFLRPVAFDRRGPSCTYDECFEDSECSKGGPCSRELGFWIDADTGFPCA